jgi:tryptophanyl-tRNA synthetase
MRQAFADGIAWGEVKQQLFELINAELETSRERYEALINDPAKIEHELKLGAERARDVATPFIRQLREAVGIRALG